MAEFVDLVRLLLLERPVTVFGLRKFLTSVARPGQFVEVPILLIRRDFI